MEEDGVDDLIYQTLLRGILNRNYSDIESAEEGGIFLSRCCRFVKTEWSITRIQTEGRKKTVTVMGSIRAERVETRDLSVSLKDLERNGPRTMYVGSWTSHHSYPRFSPSLFNVFFLSCFMISVCDESFPMKSKTRVLDISSKGRLEGLPSCARFFCLVSNTAVDSIFANLKLKWVSTASMWKKH